VLGVGVDQLVRAAMCPRQIVNRERCGRADSSDVFGAAMRRRIGSAVKRVGAHRTIENRIRKRPIISFVSV